MTLSKSAAVARRLIPDRVVMRVPMRWRVSFETAFSDLRTHDPILVYQMGKVGSSTIERTLRDCTIPNPVFHVHHLARDNIRWRAKRRARKGVLNDSASRHLAVSRGLSWRIAMGSSIRWVLISGVRDPVARAISQVFQGAKWRYPELMVDGEMSYSRVNDLLTGLIHSKGEPITDAYDWFDHELKQVFGIDVYDYPFDREKGYVIIETGQVRLLLYRLEDLQNVLSEGIVDLLGLDKPVVEKTTNVASDKSYFDVYKDVISNFRLRYEECEALYDNVYMDHFYGPEGKREFIEKWAG